MNDLLEEMTKIFPECELYEQRTAEGKTNIIAMMKGTPDGPTCREEATQNDFGLPVYKGAYGAEPIETVVRSVLGQAMALGRHSPVPGAGLRFMYANGGRELMWCDASGDIPGEWLHADEVLARARSLVEKSKADRLISVHTDLRKLPGSMRRREFILAIGMEAGHGMIHRCAEIIRDNGDVVDIIEQPNDIDLRPVLVRWRSLVPELGKSAYV